MTKTTDSKQFYVFSYIKKDGLNVNYSTRECKKPSMTKEWKELKRMLDDSDIDSIKWETAPEFIIQDWMGNHLFKDEIFPSYVDGWEFIYENVDNSKYDESGNEDDNVYQEYYVVQ